MESIKKYAQDFNVPIIQDEGLKFLLKIIENTNPQHILEIGTAIGYSAIMMSEVTDAQIITIEKNKEYYRLACENIKKYKKVQQIQLILGDALTIKTEFKKEFDLIYFDAAKGQNINFFKIYAKYLKKEGVIVIDNLNFHGFTKMPPSEIQNRNTRQLARKINEFIKFAENLNNWSFEIIDVGDGIGILQNNN